MKTTEERKAQIVDLFMNETLSAKKIHERLHVSISVIYRTLHEHGISPSALGRAGERGGPHGGNMRFPPTVAQQILTEYQAGKTLKELALAYETSMPTIRRSLKRYGIKARKQGGRRKIVPDDVAQALLTDWQSGLSQTAIGQKYGMGQTRVSAILRRFGTEVERRNVHGARHGHWKGGRVQMNGYYYVRVPMGHPFYSLMATNSGYISEHRFLMAEALGRPLREDETCHHINGDRLDNRPENLELRQGNHGKGVVYYCIDCQSTNIGVKPLAGDNGPAQIPTRTPEHEEHESLMTIESPRQGTLF